MAVDNAFFLERRDVIHTGSLAIMTKMHHAQLGEPGTGKSLVVEMFCKSIRGARFFKQLVGRDMHKDELLGTISLKGVTQDEDYRRNVDGMLPTAHVVFLDELGNAGDTLFANLYEVMNERTMTNGRTRISLPLISLFTGMNYLPQATAFDALYARIGFRLFVEQMREYDNFKQMIRNTETQKEPDTSGVDLTLEDVRAVHQAVPLVVIPDRAIEAMWEIRKAMNAAGYRVDNRKCVWLLNSVCKAEALYNGRVEVEEEDLEVLQHCLWDTPSDRQKVREIVLKVCNPVLEESLKFVDDVQRVIRDGEAFERQSIDRKALLSKWLEVNDEITGIIEKVGKRIQETSGRSQQVLLDAAKSIEALHRGVLENKLKMKTPIRFSAGKTNQDQKVEVQSNV